MGETVEYKNISFTVWDVVFFFFFFFSIFVCFRCFNSYLVLKCTVVNTSTCISIYGWYFKCSVSSSQTNLASSVVLLGFYMCVSGRLSINSARLSFKFMIHFG